MASLGATAAGVLGQLETCIYGGVCFDYWKGSNGKWYNIGWGGNQWTGGRNAVQSNAGSFKLAGRFLTVASVGIEGVDMYQAVSNRDAYGVADSGNDLMMIAPTVLGGPVGFGLGVGYSAVDNTVGWRWASGPLTDLFCAMDSACQ